jgi:hypothetical protein
MAMSEILTRWQLIPEQRSQLRLPDRKFPHVRKEYKKDFLRFIPCLFPTTHPQPLKLNELCLLYHSLLRSRYEHNLEDGAE